MSDETTSPFVLDADIALHADNVIEFNGQKFTPDGTKGYFTFSLSHGFPVRTRYGTGIHPAVTAASYQSLLHQNINWEHHIKVYHDAPGKDNHITDRVLGSVVAVGYPQAPVGGWKIGSSTPGIEAVGVYYKLTQGMAKIIGDHQTGRHKYTVSMEVDYSKSASGFAVNVDGMSSPVRSDETPADMRAANYEYWSWNSAPDDLRATFSEKTNRIAARWKGREVSILMGGIAGRVHYSGVGLVKYGAEPTANIKRMAASDPFSSVMAALASLRKSLNPREK